MKIIPEGGVVIRRKHLLVAGVVASLLVATVLVTLLVVNRSSEKGGGNKTAESQQIIRLVDKHFELPTTEQPTVAQIQDMSKLANQQFFVRAQNGDYLLLYNNERLALIYRKSADKLINVGPIDFNTASSLNDLPAQSVQ